MSTDFQYSTDFYGMNSYELSHTCMHLLEDFHRLRDRMDDSHLQFYRYCTKHLGQSPSEYRLSLQPK